MRLVSVDRDENLPDRVSRRVRSHFDFRLYDDNGKPMNYVKSVSFNIDPSDPYEVVMVIERIVMKTDKIDVTVPPELVRIEDKEMESSKSES